jgi:hypothetical protein
VYSTVKKTTGNNNPVAIPTKTEDGRLKNTPHLIKKSLQRFHPGCPIHHCLTAMSGHRAQRDRLCKSPTKRPV